MEVMKEDNLMSYVDTTFALSLNDSFWIIPLPIEIKDLNKNCVIKNWRKDFIRNYRKKLMKWVIVLDGKSIIFYENKFLMKKLD